MRNINHNLYLQIIIVGDFNLPGIDWTHWIPKNHRQNNLEFKFIECIRDTFLFQHIKHPPRSRGTNNPNILDLILTNEDNSINDIQYMCPLGKSDHSVIYFEIECHIESNNYIKIINNYNLGHYDDMRNGSSLIDWIQKLTLINDDISRQWNLFTDEIRNLEKNTYRKKS